jgi:sugar/nucleoside kinase (ribokinase family)
MKASVVVAGHLCLDIIPSFPSSGARIMPGSLSEVGAVTLATGGGVSNVGLSLLRLGIPAKLMGKVGDDMLGDIVREVLAAQDSEAAQSIVVAPGEATSYTIVISLPGNDRSFLHHPGCNDSFSAGDVDLATVAQSAVFYFGYPPLMRRFYEDEGVALAGLFESVKKLGVVTALDMAMPDPAADSGKVDWRSLLQRVLPHVDIFMPSVDETRFMLETVGVQEESRNDRDGLELRRSLATTLLGMGAGIVGLTLGDEGLYLRTAAEARLGALEAQLGLSARAWANRELWAPVFQVEVQGTTGSGDATMAGFLAGLTHGLPPERAAVMAVAVGSCSVEVPDATSGVRSWEETTARVGAGWQQAAITAVGWKREDGTGVYTGPVDKHEPLS